MNSTKVLRGVRIVSLALNLPGPAALQRCQAMGARCIKVEPPAARPGASGDPMQGYSPGGYADLHRGIRVLPLDLKSETGQRRLQRELEKADVVMTSFRAAALRKLGLDWKTLHHRHPQLGMVAIFGSVANPDEAGHDLTYQAQNGLVTGLDLPPTLYADMAGSLLASEAVLQCVLARRLHGQGVLVRVGLSEAVGWLARPRSDFGMQQADTFTGGGHAGYQVYACQDGRVALAALEPHFYRRLCAVAELPPDVAADAFAPGSRAAIAAWLTGRTRAQIDELARTHDLPLEIMAR